MGGVNVKVILSRKGFDSSAGGYPSAIMPDGRMVSFPIPDDKKIVTGVKYKDLVLDKGLTYLEIMERLGIKGHEDIEVHLDPDLSYGITKRKEGWRPVFGQGHAAQKHLFNNDVQVGDIFLFFGWFNDVKKVDGTYKYIPRTDKHIIWGYLQVGEIINIDTDKKYDDWLEAHPHFKHRDRENNTAYIASEQLTFNNKIGGAGVFSFDNSLVLTCSDQKKRSVWNLPIFFHPDNNTIMTYHENKDRWKIDNDRCILQSTGRGQEFVITGDSRIEEWAKNIILNNCVENKFYTREELAFGRISELIESFISANENNKAFYYDTKSHNDAVINLNDAIFKDMDNLTASNLKNVLNNNVIMKVPNKNKIFDVIDNEFDKVKGVLEIIKDFNKDPISNLNKLLHNPGFHINGAGIYCITQLLAGAYPDEYIVLEENMVKGLKDLGIIDEMIKPDTANGYLYINRVCKELYKTKFRDKVTKFNFGLASVHNFFWHYHVYYRADKRWK